MKRSRALHIAVVIIATFARGCSDDVTPDDEPNDSNENEEDLSSNSGGGGGQGGSACYSPEDVSTAYDDGASGCACPWSSGSSICIGGAALICDDGEWMSAEDGPCALGMNDCDGTVDGPTECLEQFETCTEDSDGTFCGRVAR